MGRAAVDAPSRNGRPVRVCHLQACSRSVTETRPTSTQLTSACFLLPDDLGLYPMKKLANIAWAQPRSVLRQNSLLRALFMLFDLEQMAGSVDEHPPGSPQGFSSKPSVL